MRARTTAGHGAAFAALILAGLAGGAQAAVVYEAIPTVGVGVTDNALASANDSTSYRDEFGRFALGARVRYDGLRIKHAFGYRLGYTYFASQHGANTLSNELSWRSGFELSGTLTLNLGADAGVTRSTALDPSDLSALNPQVLPPGPRLYLTWGARQELIYQPTAAARFLEGLSFRQLRFLESDASVPSNSTVALMGRGEWIRPRDMFSGEVHLGVNHTSPVAGGPSDTFARGNVILASLFGGWYRSLSMSWSTELAAGPIGMFKWGGPGVIAPGGRASINYRRIPWYLTLGVSQTPEPNLYLGEATISDRVLLRIALPLTQRELVFVSGVAGYTYGRIANEQRQLEKAFDQRSAGLTMTGRLPRLPFWAALEYLVVDQDGGMPSGRVFPSLFRQTILLSIGAMLVWGAGEPPLFRGVL